MLRRDRRTTNLTRCSFPQCFRCGGIETLRKRPSPLLATANGPFEDKARELGYKNGTCVLVCHAAAMAALFEIMHYVRNCFPILMECFIDSWNALLLPKEASSKQGHVLIQLPTQLCNACGVYPNTNHGRSRPWDAIAKAKSNPQPKGRRRS